MHVWEILLSPARPGEKTNDELVKALKDHFNPTPSETVQRSQFHSCFRKPGETVVMFVSKLYLLAKFCNFGTSLEDVHVHVTWGWSVVSITARFSRSCWLRNEKKLTLTSESAIETAQGLENAANNAKEIAQQDGASNSNDALSRLPLPQTQAESNTSLGRITHYCWTHPSLEQEGLAYQRLW